MKASNKREIGSFGRFSSKPQERGDSLQRQEESYRRICERNKDRGYPSPQFKFGVLFDEGKSAFHGQHLTEGHLGKFLAMLRTGEIDGSRFCLAIESFSRFNRQPPDLTIALLSEIVRQHKCALAFDRPACWIETPADIAKHWQDISYEVHHAYRHSRDLSEYLKESQERRRQKGAEVLTKRGNKPETCPCWIEVQGDAYRIGETTGSMIRQAVAMAIGGAGQTAIRKAIPGCPAGIASILRSPTLKGERVAKRRAGKSKREAVCTIANAYPALIDGQTWDKLQAAINSRVVSPLGRRGKDGKDTNLFTGLTYDPQGNRLRCETTQRGITFLRPQKGISATGLRYDSAEVALLWFLRSKVSVADLLPVHQSRLKGKMDELDAKIASDKNKVRTLQKLFAETSEDGSESIGRSMMDCDERIKQATQERDAIRAEITTDHSGSLQQCQDLAGYLGELSGTELATARRQLKDLIGRLVRRIVVHVCSNDRAAFEITLVSGVKLDGDGNKLEVAVWEVA